VLETHSNVTPRGAHPTVNYRHPHEWLVQFLVVNERPRCFVPGARDAYSTQTRTRGKRSLESFSGGGQNFLSGAFLPIQSSDLTTMRPLFLPCLTSLLACVATSVTPAPWHQVLAITSCTSCRSRLPRAAPAAAPQGRGEQFEGACI
jgi:hypothetical protein